MTSLEVLKLINAGYTKAEIEAMDNPQNTQDNTQDKQPEQPEQLPDKQSEQLPDKQPEQPEQPTGITAQDFMDWMKKVNDSMDKVVRTMQASNLQNDTIDSVGKDMTANVDKIMQSIIRPEQKEVK